MNKYVSQFQMLIPFKIDGMSICLFGLLILLISGCGNDENTVAKFGPHKISIEEYRLAYLQVLKQPNVYDSADLREKFLDELINRTLISEWAEKNYPADEKVELRVDAFRNKSLREAYYQETVEPRVSIDSNLVDKIYAYTTQRRKIKHLFLETKDQADEIYKRLENGESWKSLAGKVFNDKILSENGGDLGWVHWDQLEYDMAMTAFSQPVNTFGTPVKSTYGWHIIFVENIEINPMLTDTQLQQHRRETELLIKQRIGDKMAGKQIEDLMKDISIQVRPQVMQLVGEHLKTILNRKPNPFDKMENMQLTEQEQQSIESRLWDYRNETLAIIDGQDMTVTWFMGNLDYVPYEAIHHSFKTALDYAIRDFVLTAEAQKANLSSKYPEIDLKTRIFKEYLQQSRVKRLMVRQTQIDDNELKDFYNSRKQELFSNASFDEVKEQIKPILLAKKQRDNIGYFINRLRSNYKIKKNLNPIHEFYDRLSQ